MRIFIDKETQNTTLNLHVAVSHYMMLYFLLLLQKCMVISVVVVHAFAFCVSRILFCRMENVFLGLYDVFFVVFALYMCILMFVYVGGQVVFYVRSVYCLRRTNGRAICFNPIFCGYAVDPIG